MVVAVTAALAGGVCAMGWAWGIWGVFVACADLTLVGSTAPALLLPPESAVTPMRVAQVASCAVDELFADRAAFDAHQSRVRESAWGKANAGIMREYVLEAHDDSA